MLADNLNIEKRKRAHPIVVWDTSLCNLSSAKLQSLFEDTTKTNLFTSLTFNELINLSQKETVSDINSVKNAFDLICNILNSSCSNTILLPKDGYVDTSLIEFCKKNKYELYTYDYTLGLRAKSNHITVTIFKDFNVTNTYHPVSKGNHIILHPDIIKNGNCTIKDIISAAVQAKGNKFIITPDFTLALEKFKHSNIVKSFIRFLVSDLNNEYSIYIAENEFNCSIQELSKKYNAKVFTSNPTTAFIYKTEGIKYEMIFGSIYLKKFNKKINPSEASSNSQVTQAKNSNKKCCPLPLYSPKYKGLKLINLNFNERVIILDSQKNIINLTNHPKFFQVQSMYTVIFLKYKDEKFEITSYVVQNTVQEFNNATLDYRNKFSIDEIHNLPIEYIKYISNLSE